MNAPTKMTAKQLTGYDRLHNSRLNKGTAFTEAERSAFGLEGLLPPAVLSLELQVARRHVEERAFAVCSAREEKCRFVSRYRM